MLEMARAKTAGNPLVRVEKLDLNALNPRHPLPQREGEKDKGSKHSDDLQSILSTEFNGVFANFGVLNCVNDWRPLATWLAERVQPGGVIAFGIMSPLCLWEMAWHGLHGNFRTATRRLRKTTTFQPDSTSEAISIAYPSIHRLTRDFAPYFKRGLVEGLGLFLPPSDVYGVIEKRPRLLKRLTWLEARVAPLPLFAAFADHYWIEFVRVPSD
jgi:hypothetical protein